MTQVSARFLHPKVSERIVGIFMKVVSRLRSRDEILDFLDYFLTPTEKVMLSKRISIAYLLESGYKRKSISGVLKVSTSTISTVASKLKYSGGYRAVLGNIQRDEEIKKFILDLGENMAKVGTVGSKGSGVWRSVGTNIRKKKQEIPF